MNSNISNLHEIANKDVRHIIGLMSGTSLDGLDIAFCAIQGHGKACKIDLLAFETINYPIDVKGKIRAVFAKKQVDFEHLTLLNAWLGTYHGQLINGFCEKWNIQKNNIDLIASHGQTVYHAPKILHQHAAWPNATLQIGDADHIAVKTGIITISDFRQKHIAAGGEGAPLALYGDYLMFGHATENRLLLNMGGIANFTFIPSGALAQQVVVTDTGPGNTLLDAFTRKHFPDMAYDADASIAKKGAVHEALLKVLLEDDYFLKPLPKTTGPELFNINYVEQAQIKSGSTAICVEDLLATLTKFTACSIANTVLQVCGEPAGIHIYMSGGGAHNPLVAKYLHELLPGANFAGTDVLGIDGDAKEAILFALLANETVAGEAINFGRAGMPSVCFGKISFPN